MAKMPRKKALFLAEAVTLAHVGRAIRLASLLRSDDIDVELACDGRFGGFLADLDFPVRSVGTIPSDRFMHALDHGRPVFSTGTLRSYVDDDLSLIEKVRPDVVIGDFRLSLSVSARLARVPYVNVTNAYWSPYARPHFHLPTIAMTRVAGMALATMLFRVARPIAFAIHAMPINRVRRMHRLSALGWDVRRIYCDGDLTLYADIPEVIPIFASPANHRYIGPVLWSPKVGTPPWWQEATGGRSPIYVSLGSSGNAQLLPLVIDALAPLDHPIVVATAGRAVDLPRRSGLWVADYLPGEAIAAKACVVVCNGGSPTCHQALVNGVPVIGIARNLDQFLNMDYIARFGAGVLIRSDRVRAETLRQAARSAIDDPRLRQRAGTVAELSRMTRADQEFPAAIRDLLGLGKKNL